MKAEELINELKKLPPKADVHLLWDGEARSSCEIVFLSKGDYIVLCDEMDVIYSDESRPKDAPTEKENRYYKAKKI